MIHPIYSISHHVFLHYHIDAIFQKFDLWLASSMPCNEIPSLACWFACWFPPVSRYPAETDLALDP